MRILNLAKSGLNKVRAHQKELKAADIEESIKSITPGEWCLLRHPSLATNYIAFINPLIDEKFSCLHILDQLNSEKLQILPETHIHSKIQDAIERRRRFKGYPENSRLFYGVSDGLPGLIADKFGSAIILQINTAGVDRYRSHVKESFENLTGAKVYFLDNPKYREKESLPSFENEAIPDIMIVENGLSYKLRSEVMQKVGFYYDHRENRHQLVHLLDRLNLKFERSVDLFCYAGAWGLCSLKGGAAHCTFVDQGDFGSEITSALEMNNFQSRGTFHRGDVFKFLDDCISNKKTFDLVLSDPPAFAKSQVQKDQALEGYSKLHRKVMKVATPGALLVFSSCTHYVSHEEFQRNILEAAHREGRKLQIIFTGMQGWDHPVTSLADKSNYIKSYFYLLEN